MKILINILLLFFLLSCSNHQENKNENKEYGKDSLQESRLNTTIKNVDLNEILKTDTLKALTIYSPTSYFLYKGEVMGFEYELLEKIAKGLGLVLKIIVVDDMDKMFQQLNEGKGDIIAYGLTITKKRKEIVAFTESYLKIHQVLVQKDNKEKLQDITELGGKHISVRQNSSYIERIQNITNEIGTDIYIDTISGEFTTDDIIEMVHSGKIRYTVADNNIAYVNSTYYHDLDMLLPLSLSQKLAWAVRKDSPLLLAKINSLIESHVRTKNYNIIYNKYFKNKRSFAKRLKSEYYSKKTGGISEYDKLIKKYAKKINWDWRLLSSIIFQESRFNNHNISWVGAGGLMQIMPKTAKSLGVQNVHNPEQNIRGGTKYLKQIWEKWSNIPDSIQRIKFTLASYNCGYYHIVDAVSLAKTLKKDPEIWDREVEDCILKLSKPKYYNQKHIKYGYARGREPYNYVRDIFYRYENYKDLLENSNTE